jgi:hypothetical protein
MWSVLKTSPSDSIVISSGSSSGTTPMHSARRPEGPGVPGGAAGSDASPAAPQPAVIDMRQRHSAIHPVRMTLTMLDPPVELVNASDALAVLFHRWYRRGDHLLGSFERPRSGTIGP